MEPDPWRTDASTSISEQLDQVNLDAPGDPDEVTEISSSSSNDQQGSDRASPPRQPSASSVNLESVSFDHEHAHQTEGAPAKGKSKESEAQPNQTGPASPTQTRSEQTEHVLTSASAAAGGGGGGGTVNGRTSAAPGSTDHVDEEPHSMPTIPKNFKPPTQKKIDKSLKKSKAAPPVLPQVLSKTRQKDLPPKPKEEDNKHLKEYEQLLELSAKAEKKREVDRQHRRIAKDKELNTYLPSWEKDVVPNWKVVQEDEKLKKMWYSGSMPARFRGLLWTGCIGNGLAIGKSSYTKSIAQANSFISSGRLSDTILQNIDQDVKETLPQLKLFQTGGPMHEDLRNLLLAYSVFWKREPSYSRGVSYIAAILLINLPLQDSFVSLVNLIHASCLKHFYDQQQDYIDAYDRVFGTLLADHMPQVYHNFTSNSIRPSLYLHPWLTTVFVHFLPLDAATRIFDIFVLEGDSFLFRASLAVLCAMEARLFNPDRRELEELFRAEDKGAVAVVRRDKRDDPNVWPEEVYTQCGATEDAIFEALDKIQWKESSWERILQRELPG